MSAPETFDAFYARTAWNVTSQMHSMTGQDTEADHAVREAYARAYQQWYEVSGYRDPEAWVLKVAEEAYERRRTQAAAAGSDWGSGTAPKADPATWPGIYRPRSARKQEAAQNSGAEAPAQDGAVGIATPGGPMAGGGGIADGGVAPRNFPGVTGPSDDPSSGTAWAGGASLAGGAAGGSDLSDSTWLGGAGQPGTTAQGVMPGSGTAPPLGVVPGRTRWPGRAGFGGRASPGGRTSPGKLRIPAGLASRRMLIAGIAAVVVVAVGAYLAFGGQPPVKSGSRGPGTGAKVKPAVQMLPAGRTGGRASVPWSLVGPGWTLAELSGAHPGANGTATGPGPLSLYLVDPQGGKYLMHTWSGAPVTLLAWSGDAKHALLRVGTAAPGSQPPAYSVLTLAAGQITSLPLKADVTPVGFTRPDGFNILAIRRTASKFQLRRYDLQGAYQATLSTMPNRQPAQADGCASPCNALSSPDGKTAVWGIAGNEMQLVNNGGGLNRRLHVPFSGTPPSCLPVSWWSQDTVLANCAAPGQPSANSDRLWLVPVNGASPTALAPGSGSPSGAGFEAGAWTANGHVYVTQTTATQCLSGASGPGGLGIMAVGQGGSLTRVSVPGSTKNHDNVVAAVGSQLIVLAQTSCPGTSSLLWLNPAAETAKTLLPGPAGALGVVAAIPYRSAPAAYGFG